MQSFKCKAASYGRGLRLLPNSAAFGDEDLSALRQNDALKHTIYVAGLPPEQFFWCAGCGAHTARRARNLTKQCTNKMSNPRVAALLMAGRHPYLDKNPLLATMPRRLTYRDIGGSPYSVDCDTEASITGDECTPPFRPTDDGQCTSSVPQTWDDDPFGFSYSLDHA